MYFSLVAMKDLPRRTSLKELESALFQLCVFALCCNVACSSCHNHLRFKEEVNTILTYSLVLL